MVSMHIGTQGPVFFADLGVVSNLTFHEKKDNLDDHTVKLNSGWKENYKSFPDELEKS